MIVKNDLLGYKKYIIYQDTELFSFSTDSNLLASFASINRKTKLIVDFCSGNFPIPMYLTLRTDAKIIGVEIQQASADLGLRSIKENNLENQIEVIVLAGFLKILSKDFINSYKNKIINVHPSLIPSFCGEGYYGLKVHQKALEKGVKITGATVHFVNEIPDGGEIIFQKAVKVKKGDTPEILQRRVMEEAEWKLLPKATEKVCMVCFNLLKEYIASHSSKKFKSTKILQEVL